MNFKSGLRVLHARWNALGSRERSALVLAAASVLALLLWQFFIAPALVTLRTADAQARTLDTQLQQMQTLQKQAKALQAQPQLGYDEALRALTLATQQTLGASAELSVTADRARVTLKGASADSLARWLSQARLNARSLPIEARLTQTPSASGAVWSGVLVMGLPQR
jgi:general secretion pathway protein M